MKNIYDLDLFETIAVKYDFYIRENVSAETNSTFLRVPGGWMFFKNQNSQPVFIPFNNEFQMEKKCK